MELRFLVFVEVALRFLVCLDVGLITECFLSQGSASMCFFSQSRGSVELVDVSILRAHPMLSSLVILATERRW